MPTLRLSDAFLDRLVDSGLVPKNVTHVIIEAKWGEAIEMHYTSIETDEDVLHALAPRAEEALVEHG